MIRILKARFHQGYRTHRFPDAAPTLPPAFRGVPKIAAGCPEGCTACIDACPTRAISRNGVQPAIDLGKCLFCTDCTDACPKGCIGFSGDYRLATRTREALTMPDGALRPAEALDREALRLFGHSLKLRQVSAGGCNACEADTNVLNTLTYDLGRFGIQFVASPRHADGLLVTGPVTANMRQALESTYAATPTPRIVIAVGACAISGGPFAGHAETNGGIGDLLPVDLYIPRLPPNPWTILDGLLRLLGKIKS